MNSNEKFGEVVGGGSGWAWKGVAWEALHFGQSSTHEMGIDKISLGEGICGDMADGPEVSQGFSGEAERNVESLCMCEVCDVVIEHAKRGRKYLGWCVA